jgi:hypothetical protein
MKREQNSRFHAHNGLISSYLNDFDGRGTEESSSLLSAIGRVLVFSVQRHGLQLSHYQDGCEIL